MIFRTAIVVLILITNPYLDAHMENFYDSVLNQQADDQSPKLKCTISTSDVNWRTGNEQAEVSVDIQFQGTTELSVMPSVHLIALPKKHGLEQSEYWAPFAVPAGASTKVKQKVSAGTGAHGVRLVPTHLLWAPTKSSVWPSQSFAKAVPTGRYSVQVQLELGDGKTVSSNEIEITVIK
jgi:hypothetical protein